MWPTPPNKSLHWLPGGLCNGSCKVVDLLRRQQPHQILAPVSQTVRKPVDSEYYVPLLDNRRRAGSRSGRRELDANSLALPGGRLPTCRSSAISAGVGMAGAAPLEGGGFWRAIRSRCGNEVLGPPPDEVLHWSPAVIVTCLALGRHEPRHLLTSELNCQVPGEKTRPRMRSVSSGPCFRGNIIVRL